MRISTQPPPRGIALIIVMIVIIVLGILAGGFAYSMKVETTLARNANFEPNAQVMAPRTPQSLSKLRDTTNQYIVPPSYLDGIPRLQTKQVPVNLTVGTSTDCSEVYTGQWDQALFGLRTDLQVTRLNEFYMTTAGQYGFVAWLRGDFQFAQPAAFAVDQGVRS